MAAWCRDALAGDERNVFRQDILLLFLEILISPAFIPGPIVLAYPEDR